MNFKQFFSVDKDKLSFAGFLLVSVAIALCWIELSKPKIKTVDDLYFIKGHFYSYNFQDYSRSVSYTFRLNEFSNSFKIKADFLGHNFKIDEFRKLLNGNDLTIAISKDDVENLNTNASYFFVYSIANSETTFLDTNFTIEKHNSKFIYYACTVFFLLGLIAIYFGLKAKKQKQQVQLVD